MLREIQRIHRTDEPVCLVTFNYDTLLEDALAHLGFEIKQIDDYTRRPVLFRLFKLHGSVNCGREVDIKFPANLNMTHPPSVLKHIIEHATEQQITNRFVMCHPSSMGLADGRNPAFPAIAIPVENKQTFECPQFMIDELKSVLPHVTKLLVIGWRATEAHFLDLLKNHLKPRAYLTVVAVSQLEADDIRVRINRALPNNQPSSSAEAAAGFTIFYAVWPPPRYPECLSYTATITTSRYEKQIVLERLRGQFWKATSPTKSVAAPARKKDPPCSGLVSCLQRRKGN